MPATDKLHNATRAHFLAALARRRTALPAAAQAHIDARLIQWQQPDEAMPPQPAVPREMAASQLAALVRELEARVRAATAGDVEASEPPAGAPRELRSAEYFRASLADASVAQRVEAALAHWPENAGPLNSELLALQALANLQRHAPRYLRRFVEYLDTLLWLETLESAPAAADTRPRPRKKR